MVIVSYCSNQVYKERVLTITLNCAHLAAKMSAKKFIEVSTAQVYDSGKVSGCGRDMMSYDVIDRLLARRNLNLFHGHK